MCKPLYLDGIQNVWSHKHKRKLHSILTMLQLLTEKLNFKYYTNIGYVVFMHVKKSLAYKNLYLP